MAVSTTSTYGQSTSTSIGNGAATLSVEAWFKPTASLNGAMRPIVIKPFTTGGTSPYFEYVLTITGAAMSATGTSATRLSEFQVTNASGSRVYLDSTGLYSGLPGAWEYNQWNHIVGTYDGSTMRLYVNGTLVGSTSQTGAVASYATTTRIGGIGNSSAEYFIGNIDEVAIYTSVLSACDVQAHYYAATAPSSFTDTTSYGYDDADHRIVQTDPAGRSYCFTYDNRGNLRGTQYPNSTFSWVDTNPAGWTADQLNRHGSISSSTTSAPADSNPLADFTYTYNQDGQKIQEQRVGGYSGIVLADSPTAYWRLDETSGSTMADRSGNSNTGTYSSASLGQTGALTGEPSNSAIAVSSTSTYAQTSSTSIGNGASQLSVEAWFKPTAGLNGAWRPIVIKPYGGGNVSPYYEYQLAVTGSATSATGSSAYRWAEFDITNATGTRVYAGNFTLYTGQAGAWEYNQWNHLVGTYDGSTMRLYVNGVLAASASQSGNVTSSSIPTQVGGIGLSSVEYFVGSIDEVAIYPTALGCGTTTIGATCTSTSQIGKHYAAVSAASAGGTVNYSYDTAGRLETASTLAGATFRYCYDPDSNRTKIISPSSGTCTGGTVTSTYAYTAGTYTPVDALTSVTPAGSGATSYTYEGAGTALGDGHLTTRGSDTFAWDTWGRLTTATVGGSTACYTYDPVGTLKTRTYKTSAANCTSPSGTTNYLLGDLYETNASGTVTTSYADGLAGDLASFAGPPSTGSTVSYLYYSGHGDLAAEANSSGTATAAHTYDAWGAPGDTPPANQTAHRFTGRWDKQYDTTTSLVLMGARPYDPVIGRFLAVDPVEGGSLNNYDYAGQDPVNSYDLPGTISCGTLGCAPWVTTLIYTPQRFTLPAEGFTISEPRALILVTTPWDAPTFRESYTPGPSTPTVVSADSGDKVAAAAAAALAAASLWAATPGQPSSLQEAGKHMLDVVQALASNDSSAPKNRAQRRDVKKKGK